MGKIEKKKPLWVIIKPLKKYYAPIVCKLLIITKVKVSPLLLNILKQSQFEDHWRI